MRNNRNGRTIAAALALVAMPLAGCGSNAGSDRGLVETNSGDIAFNQSTANQVEASGNDQPPRLVAPANGSGGR